LVLFLVLFLVLLLLLALVLVFAFAGAFGFLAFALSVIPTGVAQLFPARVLCALGHVTEGPRLDVSLTQITVTEGLLADRPV
jgi:hypothetical protein